MKDAIGDWRLTETISPSPFVDPGERLSLPAFFGELYLSEMLLGYLRFFTNKRKIPRIACVTSEQVLKRVERNLAQKLPEKLSQFHRSKFSRFVG